MQKRFLRNLEVSAIGYGCMGFSHGYGPVPEKSESLRLIQNAYDLGCTFFDTAEAHGAGENERLVGEAVRPFRSKIILVTKLHLNKRDGNTEKVIRNLSPVSWTVTTPFIKSNVSVCPSLTF